MESDDENRGRYASNPGRGLFEVRYSVGLRDGGRHELVGIYDGDPRSGGRFISGVDVAAGVEIYQNSDGTGPRRARVGDTIIDLPARADEPAVAADIERLLESIWYAAVDAVSSRDFRDPEGALNEEAYLRYQRNVIRRAADALRRAA